VHKCDGGDDEASLPNIRVLQGFVQKIQHIRGTCTQSITEHHRASQSITEHHRASQSITEHHRASQSIAEHRRASHQENRGPGCEGLAEHQITNDSNGCRGESLEHLEGMKVL
jgi:hypothetical protein